MQGPQVQQVLKARKVLPAHRDCRAFKVSQAQQVHKAHRAQQVQQVHKVLKVFRAHKDPQAIPEQPALWQAHKVPQAPKATLA